MAQGQVAQQPQDGYEVESHQSSVGASGSGGLNLNLAGAVSGLFHSKSSKETNPDGSSLEKREERASAAGSGAANANAAVAAQGHAHDAGFKQHIPIDSGSGTKAIKGSQ